MPRAAWGSVAASLLAVSLPIFAFDARGDRRSFSGIQRTGCVLLARNGPPRMSAMRSPDRGSTDIAEANAEFRS
jgi:hypothetical protein